MMVSDKASLYEKLVKDTNTESGRYDVLDDRHGKIQVTKHVKFLIEKDKKERCAQRTEVWYAKRKKHITASIMAAICNANPYDSRKSALEKKLGIGKPFTGNAATRHGNKYEMEAIIKYEEVTGQRCLEFGLLESMNEDEKFLAGSPDGITASGRLIEVKCPMRRKPTHEVPSYYKYQIQFLMHTLRLLECDFIQYVPNGTWTKEIFIVTNVKYNPYFWFSKFPMLKSFWDEVNETRQRMADKTELVSINVELTDNDKIQLKPRPKKITTTECLISSKCSPVLKKDVSKADLELPYKFLIALDEMEKKKEKKKEKKTNDEIKECMITL